MKMLMITNLNIVCVKFRLYVDKYSFVGCLLFVVYSQSCLVKFDAVLMLLIESLVWICSAARLPLTPPGLNNWKWLTAENIC